MASGREARRGWGIGKRAEGMRSSRGRISRSWIVPSALWRLAVCGVCGGVVVYLARVGDLEWLAFFSEWSGLLICWAGALPRWALSRFYWAFFVSGDSGSSGNKITFPNFPGLIREIISHSRKMLSRFSGSGKSGSGSGNSGSGNMPTLRYRPTSPPLPPNYLGLGPPTGLACLRIECTAH